MHHQKMQSLRNVGVLQLLQRITHPCFFVTLRNNKSTLTHPYVIIELSLTRKY